MDPTLTERRQQYTEYLTDLIASPLHRGMRGWFDDIRADPRQRAQALKHFQGALANVPTWSALRVDTEVARIVKGDDCAYLPNLLRALFLVEAKLFMIGESSSQNVKIRVPSVEKYIHQCFIEASRVFWKKIFLFNTACSKLEQQKNYTVCDAIAVKSVRDAVRKLVPFKDLICEMEGVRVEEEASEPSTEPSSEDEDEDEDDVEAVDPEEYTVSKLELMPIPPVAEDRPAEEVDGEAGEAGEDEDDDDVDDDVEDDEVEVVDAPPAPLPTPTPPTVLEADPSVKTIVVPEMRRKFF